MVAGVHGAAQFQSKTHSPCDVSGHAARPPNCQRACTRAFAWCAERGHAEGPSASSTVLRLSPRLQCSWNAREAVAQSTKVRSARNRRKHPLSCNVLAPSGDTCDCDFPALTTTWCGTHTRGTKSCSTRSSHLHAGHMGSSRVGTARREEQRGRSGD